MITILTGENSFEIERAIMKVISSFNGVAEKIDGTEIETRQLPDLLMGATLFAANRLVIIKNLSQNKTVWADFATWLPRLSDDIQLVLVDTKLDKRTKTYKDLQKIATITEYKPWGERDSMQAEKWAVTEATSLGFTLDAKSARMLVGRVGVDQWLLYQALQKLAVIDEVNPATIEALIEANPVENVFNLFEAALKGRSEEVSRMIQTLSLTEDPYRLFGLLSGQAFQLIALVVSDKSSAEVAKDLGAHPFALSKLTTYAASMGRDEAQAILQAFAEADAGMKTSAADPWLLIERALLKTANI
jgi:DNA polymerase-3 subunit delta